MKNFNTTADDYGTSQSNLASQSQLHQPPLQPGTGTGGGSQFGADYSSTSEQYATSTGQHQQQSAGRSQRQPLDEMSQDLNYLSREAPLDGGESTFGAATSYSQLAGSQRDVESPQLMMGSELPDSPDLDRLSPDNEDSQQKALQVQRPLQQAGSSDYNSTTATTQPPVTSLEASLPLKPFLVSFMVDARGGAMRGCRHSGVRVIIPPASAPMPMRITCRYLRRERLVHPPPLMEGEACASKIMEVGPAGAKFLGPVLIEVPHFASLRGNEREIIILRSENGQVWREHFVDTDERLVESIVQSAGLLPSNEETSIVKGDLSADENQPPGKESSTTSSTKRLTRIVTTEFPQYFAIISRVRQEVFAVGPTGSTVASQADSRVQAAFPPGALKKRIKIGLQANKKPQEATTNEDHLSINDNNSHLQQQQDTQNKNSSTSPSSANVDTAAAGKRRSRFLACFGSGNGSIDLLNSTDESAGESITGGDSPASTTRQPCKEKPVEKRRIIEDIEDSDAGGSSPASPSRAKSRSKRHTLPHEQTLLVPDDYYIESEPALILNAEPKTYGKRLASSAAQTDSAASTNKKGAKQQLSARARTLPAGKRKGKAGKVSQLTILCDPQRPRPKSVNSNRATITSDEDADESLTITGAGTGTGKQLYDEVDDGTSSLIEDVITSDDCKWRTCTIQTDSDSLTVNYVLSSELSTENAQQLLAARLASGNTSGPDDGYVSGDFGPKSQDSSGKKEKKSILKQQKQKKQENKKKKQAKKDLPVDTPSGPPSAQQQQQEDPSQLDSLLIDTTTSTSDQTGATAAPRKSQKELKQKLKLERQVRQRAEKDSKRQQKEAEEAKLRADKERKKREKEEAKKSRKRPSSPGSESVLAQLPVEGAEAPAVLARPSSVKFALDQESLEEDPEQKEVPNASLPAHEEQAQTKVEVKTIEDPKEQLELVASRLVDEATEEAIRSLANSLDELADGKQQQPVEKSSEQLLSLADPGEPSSSSTSGDKSSKTSTKKEEKKLAKAREAEEKRKAQEEKKLAQLEAKKKAKEEAAKVKEDAKKKKKNKEKQEVKVKEDNKKDASPVDSVSTSAAPKTKAADSSGRSTGGFIARIFKRQLKPEVAELSEDSKLIQEEQPVKADSALTRSSNEEILSEMYPSDPNDAEGEMILEVNVPTSQVSETLQQHLPIQPADVSLTEDTQATTIDETLVTPAETSNLISEQEMTLMATSSELAVDENDVDDDEATENVLSQTIDELSEAPLTSTSTFREDEEPTHQIVVDSQPPVASNLNSNPIEDATKPTLNEQPGAPVEAEKAPVEEEVKKSKRKAEEKAAKKEKKLQEAREKIERKKAQEEAKKLAKEEKERAKVEAKRLAHLAKQEAKEQQKQKKKEKSNKSAKVAAEVPQDQGDVVVVVVEEEEEKKSVEGDAAPAGGSSSEHLPAGEPVNTETEVEQIVEEVMGEDGVLTRTTKTIETKYVTLRQEELRTSERREMPLEEYERQLRQEADQTQAQVRVQVDPSNSASAPDENRELAELCATPSFFATANATDCTAPEPANPTLAKKEMKKRVKLNQKFIRKALKLAKSEKQKAKLSARKAEAEISVCEDAAIEARRNLAKAQKEAKKAAKLTKKQHKKMDKVDKKLAKRQLKIEKRQKKLDKKAAKQAKKDAKAREKTLAKEAKLERKASGKSQSGASLNATSGSRKSVRLEDIGEPILRATSSSRHSLLLAASNQSSCDSSAAAGMSQVAEQFQNTSHVSSHSLPTDDDEELQVELTLETTGAQLPSMGCLEEGEDEDEDEIIDVVNDVAEEKNQTVDTSVEETPHQEEPPVQQ